jgi:hypothetical protein
VLRDRRKIRGHTIELIYLGASIAYVAVASALLVIVYRPLLQRWLDAVLPHNAAAPTAWTITLAAGILALILLADSMRTTQ